MCEGVYALNDSPYPTLRASRAFLSHNCTHLTAVRNTAEGPYPKAGKLQLHSTRYLDAVKRN